VMFRQLVVFALIGLLVVNSEALCPAVFRLVNAVVPNTSSLDLLINSTPQTSASAISFRGISPYVSTTPGSVTISVRITGTSTLVGNTRTFTSYPGAAYTVAATGSLSGPFNELLYNSSLFIYQEDIFPPNPGNFRGVVHRLSENSQFADFVIQGNVTFQNAFTTFTSTIYNITAKTVTAYPELPTGTYSFTLTNTSGFTFVNVANNAVQLPSNIFSTSNLYDIFEIGDSTSTNTAIQFTSRTESPTFDSVSGCILVDGSVVLPDNTNVVTYTPYYCSASTLATGIAFLLALVALFF